MPETDFILTDQRVKISVAVEPALNAFSMSMMLAKFETDSGFDEWVTNTARAVSPEFMEQHRLVFIGLHHAHAPRRSWPSFPAYLEHLANADPIHMRYRLLERYVQPIFCEPGVTFSEPPEPLELLKDRDFFMAHLEERYPTYGFIPEIETVAFDYLQNPPEMKALILSHMQTLWETALADEWRRVETLVQASVEAFQHLDLHSMSLDEAYRAITDEEPNDMVCCKLDDAREVTFVPSAHIGPYKQTLVGNNRAWLFFGARVPESAAITSPALTIAEIKVRLSALSDNTRLHILSLVAEHGELCTHSIMEKLDLTQSTAQRHLNQLTATGFLVSRRKDGAKCFSLNKDRLDATFGAINTLLGT